MTTNHQQLLANYYLTHRLLESQHFLKQNWTWMLPLGLSKSICRIGNVTLPNYQPYRIFKHQQSILHQRINSNYYLQVPILQVVIARLPRLTITGWHVTLPGKMKKLRLSYAIKFRWIRTQSLLCTVLWFRVGWLIQKAFQAKDSSC